MGANVKITLVENTVEVPDTGVLTSVNFDENTSSSYVEQSGGFVSVGTVIAFIAVLALVSFAIKKRDHKVLFDTRRQNYYYGGGRFGIWSRIYAANRVRTLVGVVFAAIAIITTMSFVVNQKSNDDNDALAVDGALTVSTKPISFTAKLTSKDVSYVIPSDVEVDSATKYGYVLGVYVDNADLTNSSAGSKISGIKEEGSKPIALPENSWGMAMSEPDDVEAKVWYAVPVSESKARTIKSTTSGTSASDKTTVYYGINVNNNLEEGDYVGTINYVAVANIVDEKYTVTFDKNTSSSVDGNMQSVTGIVGKTLKLPKNAWENDCYGFLGWSTTPGKANVVYRDQAELLLNELPPNNTVTLYAQWKADTTIDDLTYMQEYASLSVKEKMCVKRSMVQDQQYTLTDRRDSQKYTIARLYDNNIWMTTNMNLAGGTVLEPTNSNVINEYTLPESSLEGFSPNSYQVGDEKAYVYNSGNDIDDACGDTPCYSYYSWRAAVAGDDVSEGDAKSDICPKGWRLPVSSELGLLQWEWPTGTLLRSGPFKASFAGSLYDSNVSFIGQHGDYWASTASDARFAYDLCFGDYGTSDGDNTILATNYFKEAGFSVRCIADFDWNYTVTYDKNNGSTDAPVIQKAMVGTAIRLMDIEPDDSGQTLTDWNTKPDGSGTSYVPGDVVEDGLVDSDGKNVVLYAQWEKE